MEVQISREVYDKVMHWVNKADFEISGFGTVEYDSEKKIFTINDAFLLKQEGKPAETDIDQTALSQLQYKVFKDKLPGELRWWWHSHVKMQTFWSTTDRATIAELSSNGWILATVFNQRYESRTAFSCQTTFNNLTHLEDDINLTIMDYYQQDTFDSWDKEFTDNVTEKRYTPMSILHYGSATNDMYKEEARLLGMSYKDYKYIMERGTADQLERLETRLMEIYQKEEDYAESRTLNPTI